MRVLSFFFASIVGLGAPQLSFGQTKPAPVTAPAPMPVQSAPVVQQKPLAVSPLVQSKQLTGGVGIDDGGVILGANFDFVDTANENYGVYARLYSKDQNNGAPALFALGANFRGHMKVGVIDYFIAPGFGLLHHSLSKTELLFGPTLSFGLSADLDSSIALGIENSKLYSWVGEYKGIIKDSFLATVRYNLP